MFSILGDLIHDWERNYYERVNGDPLRYHIRESYSGLTVDERTDSKTYLHHIVDGGKVIVIEDNNDTSVANSRFVVTSEYNSPTRIYDATGRLITLAPKAANLLLDRTTGEIYAIVLDSAPTTERSYQNADILTYRPNLVRLNILVQEGHLPAGVNYNLVNVEPIIDFDGLVFDRDSGIISDGLLVCTNSRGEYILDLKSETEQPMVMQLANKRIAIHDFRADRESMCIDIMYSIDDMDIYRYSGPIGGFRMEFDDYGRMVRAPVAGYVGEFLSAQFHGEGVLVKHTVARRMVLQTTSARVVTYITDHGVSVELPEQFEKSATRFLQRLFELQTYSDDCFEG